MNPAASSTTSVQLIRDAEAAGSLLDPFRVELLAALREPDSAAGLARRFEVPRQRLNYHLRELEKAGLVELVEERKKGNCTERRVRAVARSWVISPAVLGVLAADPADVQDTASSAYLVAVAARAIRELADLRAGADAAGKRLPTLTVQTDVRFSSPGQQRAFAEELTRAVADVAAKYHDEAAPEGRRFRILAGAYPAPAETSADGEM